MRDESKIYIRAYTHLLVNGRRRGSREGTMRSTVAAAGARGEFIIFRERPMPTPDGLIS